jgi:hypothetical protein
VRMAAYMCGRHLNSTACNLLANLCALTLHSKVNYIFPLSKSVGRSCATICISEVREYQIPQI